MSLVFNVALPVFAVIFVGFAAGRIGILGPASSDALNKYAYWIAVPALMFYFIARAPVEEIFNGPFLIAFGGGVALTWIIGMMIGRLLGERSGAILVMQGMNGSFANVGYMGIPLFVAAFGPDNIAPPLLATVVVVTISVTITSVMLELMIGRGLGVGEIARNVASTMITSPLIVSSLAGLAVSLSGFALPVPIANLLDILAVSASPCALVAIGLFIAGQSLRAGLAEIGWVTALKLIVQPVVCWLLIITFVPLDPFWTASAIILSALPAGTLTFVVAQQYGTYVDRTSGIILVSTVLSVITLSIVMAIYGPSFAP